MPNKFPGDAAPAADLETTRATAGLEKGFLVVFEGTSLYKFAHRPMMGAR